MNQTWKVSNPRKKKNWNMNSPNSPSYSIYNTNLKVFIFFYTMLVTFFILKSRNVYVIIIIKKPTCINVSSIALLMRTTPDEDGRNLFFKKKNIVDYIKMCFSSSLGKIKIIFQWLKRTFYHYKTNRILWEIKQAKYLMHIILKK